MKYSLNLFGIVIYFTYTIRIVSPSITGVTYRDHFDFEERYRNLNECDPFYWHPLHLPEYCAYMFEKLIRSRLKKTGTNNRKRKKTKRDYAYVKDIYNGFNAYGIDDYIWNGSPYYNNILNLLRKEIQKEPSIANIEIMPQIGPAAVYHQPVSSESIHTIKKMSRAFVKANKKAYKNFMVANDYTEAPYLYYYDSEKHGNKNDVEQTENDKFEKDKKTRKDEITVIEVEQMPIMYPHSV